MAGLRNGAAAAIASILLGCAGTPGARGGSASARASGGAGQTGLILFVEPPDAEIAVDGRSRGPASGLGAGGLLPLPPGIYQVAVSRPGYATWRAEVAIRAEAQRFNVVLERR